MKMPSLDELMHTVCYVRGTTRKYPVKKSSPRNAETDTVYLPDGSVGIWVAKPITRDSQGYRSQPSKGDNMYGAPVDMNNLGMEYAHYKVYVSKDGGETASWSDAKKDENGYPIRVDRPFRGKDGKWHYHSLSMQTGKDKDRIKNQQWEFIAGDLAKEQAINILLREHSAEANDRIDALIKEYTQQGMSPEAAESAAQRQVRLMYKDFDITAEEIDALAKRIKSGMEIEAKEFNSERARQAEIQGEIYSAALKQAEEEVKAFENSPTGEISDPSKPDNLEFEIPGKHGGTKTVKLHWNEPTGSYRNVGYDRLSLKQRAMDIIANNQNLEHYRAGKMVKLEDPQGKSIWYNPDDRIVYENRRGTFKPVDEPEMIQLKPIHYDISGNEHAGDIITMSSDKIDAMSDKQRADLFNKYEIVSSDQGFRDTPSGGKEAYQNPVTSGIAAYNDLMGRSKRDGVNIDTRAIASETLKFARAEAFRQKLALQKQELQGRIDNVKDAELQRREGEMAQISPKAVMTDSKGKEIHIPNILNDLLKQNDILTTRMSEEERGAYSPEELVEFDRRYEKRMRQGNAGKNGRDAKRKVLSDAGIQFRSNDKDNPLYYMPTKEDIKMVRDSQSHLDKANMLNGLDPVSFTVLKMRQAYNNGQMYPKILKDANGAPILDDKGQVQYDLDKDGHMQYQFSDEMEAHIADLVDFNKNKGESAFPEIERLKQSYSNVLSWQHQKAKHEAEVKQKAIATQTSGHVPDWYGVPFNDRIKDLTLGTDDGIPNLDRTMKDQVLSSLVNARRAQMDEKTFRDYLMNALVGFDMPRQSPAFKERVNAIISSIKKIRDAKNSGVAESEAEDIVRTLYGKNHPEVPLDVSGGKMDAETKDIIERAKKFATALNSTWSAYKDSYSKLRLSGVPLNYNQIFKDYALMSKFYEGIFNNDSLYRELGEGKTPSEEFMQDKFYQDFGKEALEHDRDLYGKLAGAKLATSRSYADKRETPKGKNKYDPITLNEVPGRVKERSPDYIDEMYNDYMGKVMGSYIHNKMDSVIQDSRKAMGALGIKDNDLLNRYYTSIVNGDPESKNIYNEIRNTPQFQNIISFKYALANLLYDKRADLGIKDAEKGHVDVKQQEQFLMESLRKMVPNPEEVFETIREGINHLEEKPNLKSAHILMALSKEYPVFDELDTFNRTASMLDKLAQDQEVLSKKGFRSLNPSRYRSAVIQAQNRFKDFNTRSMYSHFRKELSKNKDKDWASWLKRADSAYGTPGFDKLVSRPDATHYLGGYDRKLKGELIDAVESFAKAHGKAVPSSVLDIIYGYTPIGDPQEALNQIDTIIPGIAQDETVPALLQKSWRIRSDSENAQTKEFGNLSSVSGISSMQPYDLTELKSYMLNPNLTSYYKDGWVDLDEARSKWDMMPEEYVGSEFAQKYFDANGLKPPKGEDNLAYLLWNKDVYPDSTPITYSADYKSGPVTLGDVRSHIRDAKLRENSDRDTSLEDVRQSYKFDMKPENIWSDRIRYELSRMKLGETLTTYDPKTKKNLTFKMTQGGPVLRDMTDPEPFKGGNLFTPYGSKYYMSGDKERERYLDAKFKYGKYAQDDSFGNEMYDWQHYPDNHSFKSEEEEDAWQKQYNDINLGKDERYHKYLDSIPDEIRSPEIPEDTRTQFMYNEEEYGIDPVNDPEGHTRYVFGPDNTTYYLGRNKDSGDISIWDMKEHKTIPKLGTPIKPYTADPYIENAGHVNPMLTSDELGLFDGYEKPQQSTEGPVEDSVEEPEDETMGDAEQPESVEPPQPVPVSDEEEPVGQWGDLHAAPSPGVPAPEAESAAPVKEKSKFQRTLDNIIHDKFFNRSYMPRETELSDRQKELNGAPGRTVPPTKGRPGVPSYDLDNNPLDKDDTEWKIRRNEWEDYLGLVLNNIKKNYPEDSPAELKDRFNFFIKDNRRTSFLLEKDPRHDFESAAFRDALDGINFDLENQAELNSGTPVQSQPISEVPADPEPMSTKPDDASAPAPEPAPVNTAPEPSPAQAPVQTPANSAPEPVSADTAPAPEPTPTPDEPSVLNDGEDKAKKETDDSFTRSYKPITVEDHLRSGTMMSMKDMMTAIMKSDEKSGHPYGKPVEGNVFAYGASQAKMGEGKDKAMPDTIPEHKDNTEGVSRKKIDL